MFGQGKTDEKGEDTLSQAGYDDDVEYDNVGDKDELEDEKEDFSDEVDKSNASGNEDNDTDLYDEVREEAIINFNTAWEEHIE